MPFVRRFFALSIAVCLTSLRGRDVWAQAAASTDTSVNEHPATSAKSARRPWVSRRDLVGAGVALVATAALGPLDHTISREFFEPHWLGSRPVQRTAADLAFFGGDGPVAISGALYAAGQLFEFGALSRVALHNVEAIALAAAITGVGKGLAGRALPGVAAKHAFSFGRGFHEKNGPFVAFPSGHTSAAFAIATTLSDELANERPAVAQAARPFLLAAATAVGIARVVQRVHWPSDLPLAAVIGMWSGHTVVSRTSGTGLAAQVVHGLYIVPASDGRAILGWSARW
jgi:membrane-associated phospholipid phosphatase